MLDENTIEQAVANIVLYSDAEFERRSQVPGTVSYWARKEGKALYDAAS